MLKKRIMAVIVVKDGIAVQSVGFQKYYPVGRPEIAVDFLNAWGVDEIAVVDIDASRRRECHIDLVTKLALVSHVPLTYGGGIKNIETMTKLVQAGADKVMINSAFINDPQLITKGANKFGNQCIVVSMDLLELEAGRTFAFDYINKSYLKLSPVELAKKAERLGAGELFINSVNRDGGKNGYHLHAAEEISCEVGIPVTICGGVGHPKHFSEGLKIKNISAVAAANFFHFTEHSVTTLKQYLRKINKEEVRLDSYFDYNNATFLDSGRLAKKADATLKELLFEFHPKEEI